MGLAARPYSTASFFVTALRCLIVNSIEKGLRCQIHRHRQRHRYARISYESTRGIHYRLGDLLTLNTKKPVKPERLANSIANQINKSTSKDILYLYSDSLDQARKLLEPRIGGVS